MPSPQLSTEYGGGKRERELNFLVVLFWWKRGADVASSQIVIHVIKKNKAWYRVWGSGRRVYPR